MKYSATTLTLLGLALSLNSCGDSTQETSSPPAPPKTETAPSPEPSISNPSTPQSPDKQETAPPKKVVEKAPVEPLVKAVQPRHSLPQPPAKQQPSLQEQIVKHDNQITSVESIQNPIASPFSLNNRTQQFRLKYNMSLLNGSNILLLVNEHIIITCHLISTKNIEANIIPRYAVHIWNSKTLDYINSVLYDGWDHSGILGTIQQCYPNLSTALQHNELKDQTPRLGDAKLLLNIPSLRHRAYQWCNKNTNIISRLDFDTLKLIPAPHSSTNFQASELTNNSNLCVLAISHSQDAWLHPTHRSLDSTCNWKPADWQQMRLYHAGLNKLLPCTDVFQSALSVKGGETEVRPYVAYTAKGQMLCNAYGETNRGVGYWEGPHIVQADGKSCAPIAASNNSGGYSIPNGNYGDRDNSRASSLSVWNPVPDAPDQSYWIAGGVGYCELIHIDEQTKTGKIVQTWKGSWGNIHNIATEDIINPIWLPEKKWLCLPISQNQWEVYAIDERNVRASLLFYVYTGGADQWAVILPDGRYAGSPGCESLFEIMNGGAYCPASVLAPWRNRPGEVLEQLDGNPADIAALKLATKRWLKAIGFAADNMPQTPTASILPIVECQELPLKTSEDSIPLSATLIATEHDIVRLDVRVAGSLVNQEKIKPDPQAQGERSVLLTIPLISGENVVEIMAVDARGVSSKTHQYRIIKETPQAEDSQLYVVALGVSDYDLNDLDLQYAAKDAADITRALSKYNHNSIKSLVLQNKDVAKASVLQQVQSFLAEAKPHDRVIFYLAGHGMLDNDLLYYYAPADFDPERISETGISMNELMNCLHACQAHHRLLLLDTCHSGLLGEEEQQKLANNTQSLSADIKMIQHRGMRVKKTPTKLNYAQTTRYIEEMFTMGNTSRGINIIAAASGAEFAIESNQYENGLFTATLIQALGAAAAECNADTHLSVAELYQYLAKELPERTGGNQTPTLSASEASNDFPITYNLHHHIEQKNWEALFILLQNGAKAHEADYYYSPGIIGLAIMNQAPVPTIKALLEAGAKPDAPLFILDNIKTPLVYLIEQILARRNYGENELMWYSADQLKEIIKLLLNHGANPHKTTCEDYETAVSLVNYCMFQENMQDIAEILQHYGCVPTKDESPEETSTTPAPTYSGPKVTTPLHQAIAAGKPSLVRAAIASAQGQLEARDEMDRTPLMVAAQRDRATSARLLIEAGANVNAVSEQYGTTVLMMAAMNGYHEVVEILAENGANLNAQNKSGYTALMLAARSGHISAINILLHHGASTAIKDYSGKTAADHANSAKLKKHLR